MSLVYGQNERVAAWVAHQLGYPDGAPAYASIGFEVDGELLAGVMFDNFSGTNVFAHIASIANVLPRELLGAVARYAFVQCAAKRMTFMINDDNTRAIQLVRALGAEYEWELMQGHLDGDVQIYVLWRDAEFVDRMLSREFA